MVVGEAPEDDSWEVLIVSSKDGKSSQKSSVSSSSNGHRVNECPDPSTEVDVTCMNERIFADENRRSIFLQHNPLGGERAEEGKRACLVVGIEQLVPFLMLKVWRERNLVLLPQDGSLQLLDGKTMQYKVQVGKRGKGGDFKVVCYDAPFKGR